MGEEYGQGRWGVNFYSLSFGCFCAVLDCFLKLTFLILLKGRLNVMRLSLKIQEQLWYFKNTKNIYFHEILTVSLQT